MIHQVSLIRHHRSFFNNTFIQILIFGILYTNILYLLKDSVFKFLNFFNPSGDTNSHFTIGYLVDFF